MMRFFRGLRSQALNDSELILQADKVIGRVWRSQGGWAFALTSGGGGWKNSWSRAERAVRRSKNGDSPS